jgi:hypothetical protein
LACPASTVALLVSTVAANSCRRSAIVISAISTLWVRFKRPDLAVASHVFPVDRSRVH